MVEYVYSNYFLTFSPALSTVFSLSLSLRNIFPPSTSHVNLLPYLAMHMSPRVKESWPRHGRLHSR
jgi:P2-related tail formation protein